MTGIKYGNRMPTQVFYHGWGVDLKYSIMAHRDGWEKYKTKTFITTQITPLELNDA